MTQLKTGDDVPLSLQLWDGDTGKFPQAVLRRGSTGAVLATVDLGHEADGLYTDSSETFPAGEEFLHATYVVYDDSGHTVESGEHQQATEVFKRHEDLSAAEVNAEVDTALVDHDPPTKTELDAGFADLNDLSAAEVNAEVDTALVDYDPPTKTELDAGFADLNDLDSAAVQAAVQAGMVAQGYTAAAAVGLSDATKTRKAVLNRSEIDDATAVLTVFDDDGTTPLFTFELQDAAGQPSFTVVLKKIPN